MQVTPGKQAQHYGGSTRDDSRELNEQSGKKMEILLQEGSDLTSGYNLEVISSLTAKIGNNKLPKWKQDEPLSKDSSMQQFINFDQSDSTVMKQRVVPIKKFDKTVAQIRKSNRQLGEIQP